MSICVRLMVSMYRNDGLCRNVGYFKHPIDYLFSVFITLSFTPPVQRVSCFGCFGGMRVMLYTLNTHQRRNNVYMLPVRDEGLQHCVKCRHITYLGKNLASQEFRQGKGGGREGEREKGWVR